MTFQRPKHIVVAKALHAMDASLLDRCQCYFGGGTAIVLQNGEYRLSLDVDFLCSDIDGYREIRNAVDRQGVSAIFGPQITPLRDFTSDQYGIRGFVMLDGQPIKFEIVRESRIPLEGAISGELGVPVLSVDCQFAEKLLANADRRLDRAVACRDAIDLGYLVLGNGAIPAQSVAIAEKAYGELIPKALAQALEQLANVDLANQFADALQMQVTDVVVSANALRDASMVTWPSSTFPEIPAITGALEP